MEFALVNVNTFEGDFPKAKRLNDDTSESLLNKLVVCSSMCVGYDCVVVGQRSQKEGDRKTSATKNVADTLPGIKLIKWIILKSMFCSC